MPTKALGLRGKSMVALLLACMLALLPTLIVGWYVVDGIRVNFGKAYARNTTLLNREKVFGRLSRELALAKRLARSQLTRDWLLDENNPAKRALFFREAESYRQDFHDHVYTVGVLDDGHYYLNDDQHPFSDRPLVTLSRSQPRDSWFYNTVRDTADFNLNVDHDAAYQSVVKVFFNVVIYDGPRKIGVAGTGLDLSAFLRDFVTSQDVGVTHMIFNRQGAIQAHPDPSLIALNSGVQPAAGQDGQLFSLLGRSADSVRAAMGAAEAQPGSVQLQQVSLQGRPQLLALTYIPELQWYIATAVDFRAAQLVPREWLLPLLLALLVMVGALLIGFTYAVDQLVLQPIRQLRRSALAMAAGHYEVALPEARGDEIGELSQAFAVMADKVRHHTAELESRVHQRTEDLQRANEQMVAAHKQIDDSIDYASMIQRAMLPDHQLLQALGAHHSVMWRPRDVVGGDFYVFRKDGDNCLLGVVDCAGHGVPGALMTMLARAAIDRAMVEVGLADPAGILRHTDLAMRGMLGETSIPASIATNLDAGFAYVDRQAGSVIFAGAKIGLYWSDGKSVGELRGGRRALNDKRRGEYANAELSLLPQRSYYLATDGILDQAGGEHGFGFGSRRFAEMLLRHASLPIAEQQAAFVSVLADYQGSHRQRDDITILCFRFD